jgi:hypothetical protein
LCQFLLAKDAFVFDARRQHPFHDAHTASAAEVRSSAGKFDAICGQDIGESRPACHLNARSQRYQLNQDGLAHAPILPQGIAAIVPESAALGFTIDD